MQIGVPKEVKTLEFRVSVTPGGVAALVARGHEVLVETSAGVGSGFSDKDYVEAGARIVPTAADAWAAELVVKVKEPIAQEFGFMRPGLLLFTFLHLAAAQDLARELVSRQVSAISYETLQSPSGELPLLTPMSAIAGRLAVQEGAWSLERAHGGKGLLLGGVPGTRRANVAILGGGVVGSHAARIAVGMGANVTVLDINVATLGHLDDLYQGKLHTLFSDSASIAAAVRQADLVIGAVLLAGAKAPNLVTKELVGQMEPGSVIVDVAIDQGGCIETARPTTHQTPTYVEQGVVHYCVTNMPGAVPRTSTMALTNATIPYLLRLADRGFAGSMTEPAFQWGLNTHRGAITHAAVAAALGTTATQINELL